MGRLRRPKPTSAAAHDFFAELRRLHLHAGEPRVRDLARDIGGGRVSHTTVHVAFIGPVLPRWQVTELIGAQLGADIAALKELWLRAREAEDPEPVAAAGSTEKADEGPAGGSAAPVLPATGHGSGPAEAAPERKHGDIAQAGESSPLPSLSPAERQVALMVAAGSTNIEVAQRLFISRHTVDSHLRKIFMKLGIARRVDLATLVEREMPGRARSSRSSDSQDDLDDEGGGRR